MKKSQKINDLRPLYQVRGNHLTAETDLPLRSNFYSVTVQLIQS